MLGPNPDYSGGIETVIRNFRAMSSDSLRISNISTWSPNSFFGAKYLFLAILNLLDLVKFRKNTLIHVHYGHGGSFLRESLYCWIAKLFGFVVFGTMHGNNFSELHNQNWRIFLKYFVFPPLDAIFVLSPSAQLVVEKCGRKALLRANPLSSHHEYRTLSERDNFLFFAGKLEYRKGLDLLAEAWPLIHATYPGLTLKIAGPQGDFSISSITNFPNTEYLGILKPNEISELSSKSLAIILPSRNEQSPLVIWEAMSSGTLVISSNVGGIRWILGDEYPYIMNQLDKSSIVNVLDKLMDELSNYDVIGRYLFDRAIQASPAGYLKQYIGDIRMITGD